MKTALAIALLALPGSVVRANGPAPVAAPPASPAAAANAQAAPEAKAEAQAPAPTVGAEAAPQVKAVPEAQAVPEAKVAPQAPLVLYATRGNFCGQARVLDWMMQTEVGQRLQREQQAEMEQALVGWEAEAEKQPTLPEIAAPAPK